MLNEIREKLEKLQEKDSDTYGRAVMYGRVVDDKLPAEWNYITFNRENIRRAGTNRKDFNEYFEVNLVHEDFIPEDAVYELISNLETVKGLKQTDADVIFNYATKKNTSTVVEVATITFTHPVKGYTKSL
ncbi:MAG: hypothetical protein MSA91_04440 [Lachnobacterium sp.]|nr:hypothetical protein [Lachnobacterium sp.]